MVFNANASSPKPRAFRPAIVPPETTVSETPSTSFADLVRMLAEGIAAPALPNDGVVQRPTAGALPQHGGLALVGDADRRELPVAGAQVEFAMAPFQIITLRLLPVETSDKIGFRIVLEMREPP